MWLIFGAIAALLLVGLGYLLRSKGRFHARRSLEIRLPPAAVYTAVVDLKSWPLWSPWLLHELDTDIDFSDDYRLEGGYCRWNGKRAGAGKLTQIALVPHSRVEQKLEFGRPLKSVCQVSWGFDARGDATLVSWELAGRKSFPLRHLAARTETTIDRDLELGLALLGGYLDDNSPHPALEFGGAENLEDFSYWAIPCNGKLRQLESARQPAIDTLTGAAAGRTGLPLTLYHRFEPYDTELHAEIAVPIDRVTPKSNYTRREFSGGSYLKITLRGDHRFLPLGWHALYSHCRMHRYRQDRARPALEIYLAGPQRGGNSNATETALYLPLRN
jgi:hypothetical protein